MKHHAPQTGHCHEKQICRQLVAAGLASRIETGSEPYALAEMIKQKPHQTVQKSNICLSDAGFYLGIFFTISKE